MTIHLSRRDQLAILFKMNNADYLNHGASIVIQGRFTQLIQKNILRPIRQWGPVWVYELDESSSDE